ncbi:MAG: response regulator [Pseudomonadota bacterium]
MKGRVLVIDDEPQIRRNLTVGLTQEGWVVTACPDGISAIHELERSRAAGEGYHALVTDIFMPDVDGLKILKVIKRRHPDLPVVVITGYGDDVLRFTALSEPNTAWLDKPFEIPDLTAALDALTAGGTTLGAAPTPRKGATPRESATAYLTLRLTDPSDCMEAFQRLRALPGVQRCEAVHGDVDIILQVQAPSPEAIERVFAQVRAIPCVEVVSVAPVERPRLDRDVASFVEAYREAVKTPVEDLPQKQPGATCYLLIDIDKRALQQIFTTVFFIDEVLFCDVIDGGRGLVGLITGQGAAGRTPLLIEKIGAIDGVLRVRVARVIQIIDD